MNVFDDSNIIVKHSALVTNYNYIYNNIENDNKNIYEKVDGNSNYIKQKQYECDISSMKKYTR